MRGNEVAPFFGPFDASVFARFTQRGHPEKVLSDDDGIFLHPQQSLSSKTSPSIPFIPS